MNWLEKLIRRKSKAQNQALGQQLKTAREGAGMTQTVAAAHLARDQTFIARIEKGLQQATFVEVEQLARAYGKRLEDFKTIEVAELKDRKYAIHAINPKAIPDYAKHQLERRNRRRKQKQRKANPRSRRRR